MKILLAFLLMTSVAQAADVRAPDSRLLERQSLEGNRLVIRKPDGTQLGYWTNESGTLVHRKPDGTRLESVR